MKIHTIEEQVIALFESKEIGIEDLSIEVVIPEYLHERESFTKCFTIDVAYHEWVVIQFEYEITNTYKAVDLGDSDEFKVELFHDCTVFQYCRESLEIDLMDSDKCKEFIQNYIDKNVTFN